MGEWRSNKFMGSFAPKKRYENITKREKENNKNELMFEPESQQTCHQLSKGKGMPIVKKLTKNKQKNKHTNCTVCPRSSDPFYIVSYYIKLDTRYKLYVQEVYCHIVSTIWKLGKTSWIHDTDLTNPPRSGFATPLLTLYRVSKK